MSEVLQMFLTEAVVILLGAIFTIAWFYARKKWEVLEKVKVFDEHNEKVWAFLSRGAVLAVDYIDRKITEKGKSETKLLQAVEFVVKFLKSVNIELDREIIIGAIESRLEEKKTETILLNE